MKKFFCFLAVASIALTGYADDRFWCSARGEGATPPHMIHLFDDAGVWVTSVEQVAGAQTSAWGYRDGASDRDGHVYFGWETGLARHDAVDGGNATTITSSAAPGGVGTWRALGYDPDGDNGNGSLFVQNFGSSIIEVRMNGALITNFGANGESLYGLAYDASDGNFWGHHSQGVAGTTEIVKISSTTGQTIAFGWVGAFPNSVVQGGLSGMHDGSGNVAAISQGTPDELGVYDTSGTLVLGPIDIEGQTFSNGHLGVAVIVSGEQTLCGDANCDGTYNGGDIDPFFMALGNPAGWMAMYSCDYTQANDINGDGAVNGADIDPFFVGLGIGQCPPGPTPPPAIRPDTERAVIQAQPANDVEQ